jgi:integrase
MPRKAKGPRLYVRHAREARAAVYYIRDGGHSESTGCLEGDADGAEQALAAYIAEKHRAPKTGGQLDKTTVADVVLLYVKEHAPKTKSLDFIRHTARPIGEWWGDKTLARVNVKTCAEYVAWSVKQGVSDQTARHDLKTLRAAINYYNSSEHGPLLSLPVVTVPARAEQRDDYYLTRKEVADRIRAARRLPRCRHVIRQLLIGCYTGTRPGATLRLRWLRSTSGGCFDLGTGTLYRRAEGEKLSRKQAPKCRIHSRLLPWLRRWKAQDEAAGISYVVHYYGKPVKKLRRSWDSVAREAGATRKDGPHIMRHTAATWQMQAGVDPYEAGRYLGMSVETLMETYWHHHPDFQEGAANASGRKR